MHEPGCAPSANPRCCIPRFGHSAPATGQCRCTAAGTCSPMTPRASGDGTMVDSLPAPRQFDQEDSVQRPASALQPQPGATTLPRDLRACRQRRCVWPCPRPRASRLPSRAPALGGGPEAQSHRRRRGTCSCVPGGTRNCSPLETDAFSQGHVDGICRRSSQLQPICASILCYLVRELGGPGP